MRSQTVGVSRRDFLKGLSGGIVAATLIESTGSQIAESAGAIKIKDAVASTSICPFCGVGCGLIAHTVDGRLVNVEGDPQHPINQGALCSKGQAVHEVVTSPRRLKKVLYRAPGGDRWEEKDLDWAIGTIAQRIKSTRDGSFINKSENGTTVNRTEAIASIGAAALNNEECYLISKLARSLGLVYLEHQARL